MLGEEAGRILGQREWVGVPFAGGMSELKYIKARTMHVSDLHRHVVNLARVVQDPGNLGLRKQLISRLDETPFHPDVLAKAQAKCRLREEAIELCLLQGRPIDAAPDLEWAYNYFICAWMARNGEAGKNGEFNAPLSVRWTAGGGDSAVRFRNATASLDAWSTIMQRCTFECLDAHAFIARAQKNSDRERYALYLDPPWVDKGADYKCKFDEEQHRRMEEALRGFEQAAIVVRAGACDFVDAVYPEGVWDRVRLTGRTQKNVLKEEFLLVRNLPS